MGLRGAMNLRWAAVLAWAALVALLSLVPGRALPGPGIPGLAEVAHFGFYAVLGYLAGRAAGRSCFACWAAVVVSCGLYGAALELAQRFLPGRSMSAADALMNFAGAAAGGALYVLWSRARARV